MTPSEVATCLGVRDGRAGRIIRDRTYTDSGGTELDGFERVLYLEETAFGREGTGTE